MPSDRSQWRRPSPVGPRTSAIPREIGPIAAPRRRPYTPPGSSRSRPREDAMDCRDPRPRFVPRERAKARRRLRWMILVFGSAAALGPARGEDRGDRPIVVRGLTGEVSDVEVVVPEAETIQALADAPRAADVDLKRMAAVGDELPDPHAAPGPGIRARLPVPPAPLPAGPRGAGPRRRVRHRRADGLGMVLHARGLRLRRRPGRRGRVPQAHPVLHRRGRQGLEPSRARSTKGTSGRSTARRTASSTSGARPRSSRASRSTTPATRTPSRRRWPAR